MVDQTLKGTEITVEVVIFALLTMVAMIIIILISKYLQQLNMIMY